MQATVLTVAASKTGHTAVAIRIATKKAAAKGADLAGNGDLLGLGLVMHIASLWFMADTG